MLRKMCCSMSDITKCSGEGCLVKDMCYRFTAEGDYYQAYFVDPPFTIADGVFKCDMFWGDAQEDIWGMLKSITAPSSSV